MKSKISINRRNVVLGLCSALALSTLPVGVVYAENVENTSVSSDIDIESITQVETVPKTVTYSENGVVYTITETEIESETTNPDVDDDNNGNNTGGNDNTDTEENLDTNNNENTDLENDNTQTNSAEADVSELEAHASISYKTSVSNNEDGSIDNLVKDDTIVITFKYDDDLDGGNLSSREAFESGDLVVTAGDITFSSSDSKYDNEKGSYAYEITEYDAKNGITFTATYESSGNNSDSGNSDSGDSGSEQNDNVELKNVTISSDSNDNFVGATLTAKTTTDASGLSYQWLIWDADSSTYINIDSGGTSETYKTLKAGIYAVKVTQAKDSTEDGTADIVKYSSEDDTNGYEIKETTQTTTYKLTLDSSIQVGENKDIKLSISDINFDGGIATLNENTSIIVTVLNTNVLNGDKSIYVNNSEVTLKDLDSDGTADNFSVEMTSDTTLKIGDSSSSNEETEDTINLIFEGIGIEFSYIDTDSNETIVLSKEDLSKIPNDITLTGTVTNQNILDEIESGIVNIYITYINTEIEIEIEQILDADNNIFTMNMIPNVNNTIKVEIKVTDGKASVAELEEYAEVKYEVANSVDKRGFDNIMEDDIIKITFDDSDDLDENGTTAKVAFESGDLVIKAGNNVIEYDSTDTNYSDGVYTYIITSDDVTNGIMFSCTDSVSTIDDKIESEDEIKAESILESEDEIQVESESILELELEDEVQVQVEEVNGVSLFMPITDFSYSTAIASVNSFGQLSEVSFQEAQQVSEKAYTYTVKASLETGDNMNSVTELVILDELNFENISSEIFEEFSGDANSAGIVKIDNSALHTDNKLTFKGTNVEKVAILTNDIMELSLPNIETNKLDIYALNIRNLSIPDTITSLETAGHSNMIIVTILGDGTKVINYISGDGGKIDSATNMFYIGAIGGNIDITYSIVETLNIVVEYKGIKYTIILTTVVEEILYGISVVSDVPTIDIEGIDYKILKVNATLKDDLSDTSEIYIPRSLDDIDWEEASLSKDTNYSIEDLSVFKNITFNISVDDFIDNGTFKIQDMPNLNKIIVNNPDVTSIVIEGEINEDITIVAEPKSNINSIALINDTDEGDEETTIVNKITIENNTGAELSNITVSIDDYSKVLNNISNDNIIVIEPPQDLDVDVDVDIDIKIDTEITGGSITVKTNNDDIDSKVNVGDILVLTAVAESKYEFTEWNITYENDLGEILVILLENVISQMFEVTDDMNSISISAKFSSTSSSSSNSSSSIGSGSLSNSSLSLGTSSEVKINTNTASTESTESTIVNNTDKSITLKYNDNNSSDEKYKEVFEKYKDIDSHWGKNSIAFGIAQGYLYGSSDTMFSADENVTREMIVQVLSKMSNDNIYQYTYSGSFNDVSYLDSYSNAVAWAIQKDIVKGTTTTTFSPNDDVSRQDMCTFLVRFADALGVDLPTINDPVTFADNKDIYDSASANVRKLQQAGIINGKLNNKFDPQGITTKAEFATMIERFVLLISDEQNKSN